MCPRLGDAYARSEAVLEVRADVVFHRLRKVSKGCEFTYRFQFYQRRGKRAA